MNRKSEQIICSYVAGNVAIFIEFYKRINSIAQHKLSLESVLEVDQSK